MGRDWMLAHDRGSAFGGYAFGRSGLERFRRWVDERGYQYAEDYFCYPLQIGSLAAGATALRKINIERDSVFEWSMTTGGAGSATAAVDPFQGIDIQFSDGGNSRQLMNRAIPMANMVGSGEKPFILPIPRRFMPRSSVTVAVHNYTAATTLAVTNLTLHGRKIFEAALAGAASPPIQRFNQWDVPTVGVFCEDIYSYDFASLGSFAPSATPTDITEQIEADSDFEWILSTFSARNTRTGLIVTGGQANFTLQIHDGTDNRDLFSAAVPTADITGSGEFPYVLRQPRIWVSKSPVRVSLVNADADTFDNVHFTMHGRKVFEMSR